MGIAHHADCSQGIGSFAPNRLIARFRQPKLPIFIATALLPVGVGLLAQALYNNEGQIKTWMIISGVGVGLGFGPLSKSLLKVPL